MRSLPFAVLLLAACASSPLIRPDDAEFRAAQARLLATEVQVRGGQAPPEEQALFLQAESFYRYRWSLHLHDGRAYALQTVAAALDFGPFSALASGNGVSDLRLEAYDGAAQLYEAQLARFPEGKLATLSLWRLGWAYRAAQSAGFPRTSEQAFTELAAKGDPLSPLAAEALKVPWRSQDTAIALSILPGLGQIYAGETLNGVVRMVLGLGFATLMTAPLVVAARQSSLGWQRVAWSSLGFIGLQVVYTTSFQDAQRAALEFDEREEAAFMAAHPAAP
ncbi:MAG: tetratricopeptide repeat protein [Myxococcales bacterium]